MLSKKIENILNTTSEKKIATREAYGNALAELGQSNKDIVVLDCDLSKSTKTAVFGKRFPDRFFNMGIAESNMMSVAAGLAAMGKIPFASTFSVFATKRACDQVSISVAYPKLNVKINIYHLPTCFSNHLTSHQPIVLYVSSRPKNVTKSTCRDRL